MKKYLELTRRRLLQASGAAAAGALLNTAYSPYTKAQGADAADMIIENGMVITNDPIQPRAEAIAIKNGLIQAVGTNADVMNLMGNNTKVINAQGKTVIPGLNDSHQHPTRAGRFYAL